MYPIRIVSEENLVKEVTRVGNLAIALRFKER